MSGRTQPFAWGPFLRRVAAVGIPVALQKMLTTTGTMVDTVMIAPLGENSVGAIGLCAQFTSLMFSCYWGFVGGGMLFFSQYFGAGDEDGIDRSYGVTLTCMMTVAFTFAALGLLVPEAVMRLYTDKVAIQEIGVQYLRVAGFAWPLQIFSVAMSSLLRSTDRVRIPLYASIASVASNIVLNWVFILGHLGVPAMGVRGAALATVLAAAINVLVCLLLSAMSRYPYLFQIRKHFQWTREHLQEFFRKCFPILCNELLIGIGNAGVNMVLGRQQEEAIAAIAVFRTLEGLVIAFFAGFSNAASILIGTCVGAGELETAYERARRLVYLCSGTILVVCVAIFSARGLLFHAMGLSGLSFSFAEQFLFIYCIAATIRMGNWAQNDTFRAAGDPIFGTVLEIVCMYLIVLPSVFLSGMVAHAPLALVFVCCYLDEPFRYVLMQIHLYSAKWIRPVTEPGQRALEDFRRSLAERRAARSR